MRPMRRRKWLWIGGGALAVLVLLAAALFAPRPREGIEQDLEQFAAMHGLREVDLSELHADEETDDGLKIRYSPSYEARRRMPPTQLFESDQLSVKAFEKLRSRLEIVLDRGGSLGGHGGASESRTKGVLTHASFSRTLLFDWGEIDVSLVFSLSDDGKATTWLAVWKSRRSLWDRVRDKFSPIAP